VQVDAMVAASIKKASFGGDRSAAGRYAAEQRWKNHQKKEDDKKGRGAKSPLAQSIIEANESLSKAGMTVRTIEITKRDSEVSKRLADSVTKSAEKISKKLFGSDFPERWFVEAFSLMKSSVDFEDYGEYNYRNRDPKGDFVIVVEKGNQIVGAMRFVPDSVKEEYKHLQEGKIPTAGSFRVAKGIGTAMFGEALKLAAKTGTGKIKIEALDTAEDFWKAQGFQRVEGAKLKENSTYDMTIDADTVQALVKEISS
jgi:predicted GNAT family N-acyltransferase